MGAELARVMSQTRTWLQSLRALTSITGVEWSISPWFCQLAWSTRISRGQTMSVTTATWPRLSRIGGEHHHRIRHRRSPGHKDSWPFPTRIWHRRTPAGRYGCGHIRRNKASAGGVFDRRFGQLRPWPPSAGSAPRLAIGSGRREAAFRPDHGWRARRQCARLFRFTSCEMPSWSGSATTRVLTHAAALPKNRHHVVADIGARRHRGKRQHGGNQERRRCN